jgi:hypothetical protein
MKRLLLALLLFGAAVRAEAVDFTDIWYNADQPGYGFNFVMSDDGTGHPFIFATFYVYGQSNKPTWLVAGLTWDGVDTFAGGVYAAASGTFYGAPWNAADYKAAQVGTATFKPSPGNNYQGTLAYSVTDPATGVGSASIPIERQYLGLNATGGNYVGGQTGAYTGCATASNNRSYIGAFTLTVSHLQSGSATYAFSFGGGVTCTLTGTYEQHGQYYLIPNATYACSNGLNTTARMTEIKSTALGIEGRLFAPSVGDGCAENARFAAVFVQ